MFCFSEIVLFQFYFRCNHCLNHEIKMMEVNGTVDNAQLICIEFFLS